MCSNSEVHGIPTIFLRIHFSVVEMTEEFCGRCGGLVAIQTLQLAVSSCRMTQTVAYCRLPFTARRTDRSRVGSGISKQSYNAKEELA